MVSRAVYPKEFRPGTTGWSAADLDDPEVFKSDGSILGEPE